MDQFTPDRNYYKPIDKKTNLVKRCVGVPGDSLEVRDGYVYINGEKNVLPDRAKLQFAYDITLKGNISTWERLIAILKKYDITDSPQALPNGTFVVQATEEAAAKVKNHPNIAGLTK